MEQPPIREKPMNSQEDYDQRAFVHLLKSIKHTQPARTFSGRARLSRLRVDVAVVGDVVGELLHTFALPSVHFLW